MDKRAALTLLTDGRTGIVSWNLFRKASETIPDLREADLSETDLRLADLHEADLRGAKLDGADFSGANLSGAKLSGAKLSGAKLSGAKLREADLFLADLGGADLYQAKLLAANLGRANLREANLRGANLCGANLSAANVLGANLGGAICEQTTFVNLDLSTVKGLDSVEHRGPSSVGTDTLFLSKGNIPEAFLRGCGVPDALITYLPSLIGSTQPIQFYSCFISHSSKNHKFVRGLHSRMVQQKLRVWYAPQDMRGGRKSIDQIDEAIRIYDKLLLVLSRASMASDWALHEVRRAVEREKREARRVLFPIGFAPRKAVKAWSAFDSDLGKDLAKVVREYHIPYFSKWKDHDSFEAAFGRLLEDLKAGGSGGRGVVPAPAIPLETPR
jgi:TIR domain/Pentapeptide repeats (8 copies)